MIIHRKERIVIAAQHTKSRIELLRGPNKKWKLQRSPKILRIELPEKQSGSEIAAGDILMPLPQWP
jgi:hypothetical protein